MLDEPITNALSESSSASASASQNKSEEEFSSTSSSTFKAIQADSGTGTNARDLALVSPEQPLSARRNSGRTANGRGRAEASSTPPSTSRGARCRGPAFDGVVSVLMSLLEPPPMDNILRSFQFLYEAGMISSPDDRGALTNMGKVANYLLLNDYAKTLTRKEVYCFTLTLPVVNL
jgi:hypothetical protein